MATTSYGTNHPLAVKLWSKLLYHEAIKKTYAGRFMGTSDSSLIQLKNDLKKSAGDRIRVGLRMALAGDGIQGDSTLEGNEEALVTYSDSVFVDQLRHAVRSSGKMSEQRVLFDIRTEARNGLSDWWAERIDASFFNQIAGATAVSDTRYTGNQATIAPTASTSIMIAAGAIGGLEVSLSATTTQMLKFVDLDRAVTQAKTMTPMIRPLKVDGEDKYVAFLHPNQVLHLRRDASTAGNFIDLAKAQLQGGRIKDNPLYTGALGEYNNIVLHEAFRIPTASGAALGTDAAGHVSTVSDFRRAVLCGAQAAIMAIGQDGEPNKMRWAEEEFDYENQFGVSAGMIFGIKKAVFNSQDFGTIVISSYAPVA